MYIRKRRSAYLHVANLMATKTLSGEEIKDDDQPETPRKFPKFEPVSEEEQLRLADNF